MVSPKNLARMPLEALIELRNAIASTLSGRAAEFEKQLSRIAGTDEGSGARRGRGRRRGAPRKGRKVAPKYRSKKNPKLTWAGRGAVPRWMRTEMRTGKLKKEAFLIKSRRKAKK